MIRVGTAGWHYDDWSGFVYPKRRPRGFDPLEQIARLFDALEVNVTFYRVPDPSMTASWVKRVAFNQRFRFTVKVPRALTHGRSDPAQPVDPGEAERRFREAVSPIAAAGRLGALLVQFPQSFHRTEESLAHLEALLARFPDLPCVAEFRHAGWGEPSAIEHMKRLGAGFCNIDQPRLAATLRPTEHATAPVAYIRLHGRNAAAWFAGGDAGRRASGREPIGDAAPGPAERYNYLYSEEELRPWIASIRRIAEQAADTYVIANNHFRGKAAVNALQIRAALEGALVEVPDPLLAAYPVLAPIAKVPLGRLPFE